MKILENSLKVILGLFILILSSCHEKDDFSDNIEFTRLMMFRPDSSYYTCTKYVPELDHSVRIKGNAYVDSVDDGYGVGFYNYTDTVNWKNELFWAFLNEHMAVSYYCKIGLGKIELQENISVFEPCIEGTCSLGKWNHDIPLALYKEDPDKASWLEITMIDSVQNMVEGKFQFHFVFDSEQHDSAAAFARKISYVNGEFRVKAFF